MRARTFAGILDMLLYPDKYNYIVITDNRHEKITSLSQRRCAAPLSTISSNANRLKKSHSCLIFYAGPTSAESTAADSNKSFGMSRIAPDARLADSLPLTLMPRFSLFCCVILVRLSRRWWEGGL
jgi:hypothetical protein